MKVPYYEIFGDRSYLHKLDEPVTLIFDTLVYAKRRQLTLNGLNHFFLVSNVGGVPRLPLPQRTAMNYLFASIGFFFDVNLKSSPSARSFMSKGAVANGLPPDLVKLELSKP